MSDWFTVVENSQFRRSALLSEAAARQRVAGLGTPGVRDQVARALIQVAVWVDPVAARAQSTRQQARTARA